MDFIFLYDSAEPNDWPAGPAPVTATDSFGAYFDGIATVPGLTTAVFVSER